MIELEPTKLPLMQQKVQLNFYLFIDTKFIEEVIVMVIVLVVIHSLGVIAFERIGIVNINLELV